VQIKQFDPSVDTAQLRACFEMTEAGWSSDHPNLPAWPLESFTGKWIHGFDECPQQAWLAVDDADGPVGAYLLRLPEKENEARARCILIVAPAHRRRGIGTALLKHCADEARRAGRSWLQSDVRDDSAGASFAAAVGGRGGIAEVSRVLDIDSALPGRLANLRSAAQPHAAGYSILSWSGATPEVHMDRVVRLHNAMSDAPRDEGVEPVVWDADRVRKADQKGIESGLHSHSIVARHEASGEFAALTEMILDRGSPEWGFQGVTVVLPDHRGHRLGLLVKTTMLELLTDKAPEVRRIFTDNAGSNEHMIAINEQLGFQIKDVTRSWELDLAVFGQ
jgi:GNAT superfamily N-acetyltransferase